MISKNGNFFGYELKFVAIEKKGKPRLAMNEPRHLGLILIMFHNIFKLEISKTVLSLLLNKYAQRNLPKIETKIRQLNYFAKPNSNFDSIVANEDF